MSAHDHAAVLDSRIQDVNEVAGGGPLQWLPGIPHRLAADPHWGPYLNARSHLVADLAGDLRPTGPHPSSVTPLKPGNNTLTSGSPPPTPVQNGNGGNCSLQKLPVRPRTHSCQSCQNGCATSPGPASMPPCSCGRRPPPDPYPTTTPPQPSSGASSINYRKRRTQTLQPSTLSQRPGARPRQRPCRARRCLARSAQVASYGNRGRCRGSSLGRRQLMAPR
jgi:hypothetical protein